MSRNGRKYFGTLLGGASKTLWTPLNLGAANLAQFDPSNSGSVTLNASTVSGLADLSSNARNISQPTGANQPTFVTNGLNTKPIIRFVSGSSTRLFNSSPFLFARAGGYTAVGLVKYASGMTWFGEGPSSGSAYYGARLGNTQFSAFVRDNSANILFNTSFGSSPGTNWGLAVFRDTTTALVGFSNGGTGASSAYTRSGTFSLTGFALGAVPFYTDYISADYAEMIFIDGTNDSQRQKAEGYLAWKWGPSGSATDLVSLLPSNHPYKSRAPYVSDP